MVYVTKNSVCAAADQPMPATVRRLPASPWYCRLHDQCVRREPIAAAKGCCTAGGRGRRSPTGRELASRIAPRVSATTFDPVENGVCLTYACANRS